MKQPSWAPDRIVCLTAETTEIAFALGAGDRVVGVSAYAMRPPEARKKPRVSAFTTAKVDEIVALQPDLILSFSDLQADIVRDLVARGLNVLSLNQRSLAETISTVQLIGSVIGCGSQAEALAEEIASAIARARESSERLSKRPRVYFEEWHDPMISGIRWVSEMVELAGGDDIFAEFRDRQSASQRIVDPDDVVRRDPEIIVASWCGKRVIKKQIFERSGWQSVTAIRDRQVHEIPSPDILAPGPSLLHGLTALEQIVQSWIREAGTA